MEKKFYTDDFEQFLKETTDDFRMYPSKRVWNSLYNDLHPGRKWPSLAVCLLLVSSIIFIGLSHKNEITGSANLANKHTGPVPLIAYQGQSNSAQKKASPENSLENKTQKSTISSASIHSTQGSIQANINTTKANSIKSNNTNSITNNNVARETSVNTVRGNNLIVSVKTNSTMQVTTPGTEDNTSAGANEPRSYTQLLDNNFAPIAINYFGSGEISLIEKQNPFVVIPKLSATTKTKNNTEKEWIEDYAFHNQPIPSLKSRIQYQFYVTPSAGFRTLKQNAKYAAALTRPSLVTTAVPDGPNPLQHNYGFNLEAGYSLVYAYSKSMHIKGGFQFNFTNYRIHAHELGHTTYTNLVLNDPYAANGVALSQRSSKLANLTAGGNDKKLNSSTFQVSLPIGFDLKFAGKHNLQWFVGATVQPTYVLFGNAYLISSDSRNYVYDSKFLRKFNLNAGIEAFVSYRTKTGVTFNAGPQFRYQFFSTYKDKYSFTEKLYNIGLKIGMTRNF